MKNGIRTTKNTQFTKGIEKFHLAIIPQRIFLGVLCALGGSTLFLG